MSQSAASSHSRDSSPKNDESRVSSQKAESPERNNSARTPSDNDSDLCYSRISSSLERQQNEVAAPVQPASSPFEQASICSAESYKKIAYGDLLIHNVNISLQEHQKKLAMYKKRFSRK